MLLVISLLGCGKNEEAKVDDPIPKLRVEIGANRAAINVLGDKGKLYEAGIEANTKRLDVLESGGRATSGGAATPTSGGVVTSHWPPGVTGVPTVTSGGAVAPSQPTVVYVTSPGQPQPPTQPQPRVNGTVVTSVTNPDILDRLAEHFGPNFERLNDGQSKLLAGQKGLAQQSEAIHNHLDYISQGVRSNGEALGKVQTGLSNLEQRVSNLEPTAATPTPPAAQSEIKSTRRQRNARKRDEKMHHLKGDVYANR